MPMCSSCRVRHAHSRCFLTNRCTASEPRLARCYTLLAGAAACGPPDGMEAHVSEAAAPVVETSSAPPRDKAVLLALILVAAVANLNLAVANVALPDIGIAFDSSQTTLDLVA